MTMKFERSFDGEFIPIPLGRLYLKGEKRSWIVRLVCMPDGRFCASVDKAAIEDKALFLGDLEKEFRGLN